jgi:hypothetical protein
LQKASPGIRTGFFSSRQLAPGFELSRRQLPLISNERLEPFAPQLRPFIFFRFLAVLLGIMQVTPSTGYFRHRRLKLCRIESVFKVSIMPDTFRIDSDHLTRFDLVPKLWQSSVHGKKD